MKTTDKENEKELFEQERNRVNVMLMEKLNINPPKLTRQDIFNMVKERSSIPQGIESNSIV